MLPQKWTQQQLSNPKIKKTCSNVAAEQARSHDYIKDTDVRAFFSFQTDMQTKYYNPGGAGKWISKQTTWRLCSVLSNPAIPSRKSGSTSPSSLLMFFSHGLVSETFHACNGHLSQLLKCMILHLHSSSSTSVSEKLLIMTPVSQEAKQETSQGWSKERWIIICLCVFNKIPTFIQVPLRK